MSVGLKRRRSLPMLQTERAVRRKLALTVTCCVLLALGGLATALYFIITHVEANYYRCPGSVTFIPMAAVCDGLADCAGREDESTCFTSLSDNTTYPVRLVGEEEVLQVLNGQFGWSYVCADHWTTVHTLTACKQLGYTKSPWSVRVPIKSLSLSQNAIFAAVQPKDTPRTHIQSALSLRKVCATGSVLSLVCSDCGTSLEEGRVVGGDATKIEEWPWQASMRWNGQHFCGGSLITLTWVISAAHCFNGGRQDLGRLRVVLGQTHSGAAEGLALRRIVKHEDYDAASNDYDIAMIQLTQPVSVGDTILPVCLPVQMTSLVKGAGLVVTGWGLLTEDGRLSHILQWASVPLVERTECSKPSLYGSAITPRMLCAGYPEGRVDACQGDSGGPLVFLSTRWELVGIVSWGVGCARPGYPGVYTDVQELLNWIYIAMESYS